MKHLPRFLVSVATVFSAIFNTAASTQTETERLHQELSKASNIADSTALLYDIFDLSEQSCKLTPGWQLLAIAERTRNDEMLSDMITQLAVIQKNDTIALKKLANKAKLIRGKDRRLGAKLFIDVMDASMKAHHVNEATRHDILVNLALQEMGDADDIYGEIRDLYHVVLFLGQSTNGNFYLEYLDRLEKLIDRLPEENAYLKNLFYTSATNTYSAIGNHEKAVECDRKLLEIIDTLKTRYAGMGRKYRNYDRYEYLCYRRMLRNYKVLTLDEVKEYYTKCGQLASTDPDVAADFHKKGRPTVYRMLATKDYTGLIPKIKNAIETNTDKAIHCELLGSLVEVADSLNDKATLLPALREYNNLLSERLENNSEEAYRELQIRYDLNRLKTEKIHLELEKRDAEISTRQKLIVVALGAVLVLALFVMWLYRNLFRLRHFSRELRNENVRLKNQIDELTSDGFPAQTSDLRHVKTPVGKEN